MEINILFPRNQEEADYLIQIACSGRQSTRNWKCSTQILREHCDSDTWIMSCKNQSLLTESLIYTRDGNTKSFCIYSNGAKCGYYYICCERIMRESKIQKHWGVFEFLDMTVDVSAVSRACTHQLVRHRIPSYLQQSQREVKIDVDSEDWYVIPESLNEKERVEFKADMKLIAEMYTSLLRNHIKGKDEHKFTEDARFVLANACKTNILVKTNIRDWHHIFHMRLPPQAQWEIRHMAQIILNQAILIYRPYIFEGAGELVV